MPCSHRTIFGRFGNRSNTMWTILGEIESYLIGSEWSCSHHTGSGMLHIVLVWERQPSLKSERMITRFCSKKWGWPAEQSVHIRSWAFQKPIRYGTYLFWYRSVPGHYGYKNRARSFGSSVNKRAIRYSFRGAPIIDQVQCKHGFKLKDGVKVLQSKVNRFSLSTDTFRKTFRALWYLTWR